MIYPSINDLMKTADSRYTLVVEAAKRARQLVDGSPKLSKVNSEKEVTIAINEIAEGKITYVRTNKEKVQVEDALIEETSVEEALDEDLLIE
ncbi:DNA-directed RNA polymerase subunit omega [Ruminiclostridium sufflavum DSM 19573]|uniref:DNA-directed RNA polymerase subunit omega n=1 Tax=Ruminiclostridium sufflavum DSM 19573 TaxID=1121337 RepID=A0A318XJX9_9FIRM|nr:DNA-directed RNA polymerase subunit omega [Ruminiclostridium sufflavum DSM 19573]